MAIAGLVLGIVAVVFGVMGLLIVPLFISIPCGVVGLPLSAVAMIQGRRRQEGIGVAIAGIACCIVGLILSVIMILIGALFVADLPIA